MKNKSAFAILTAVFLGSTYAFADPSVPKSYPLSKCVVSGETLGAHGKPVLFLHPKDFCGTLVELEQA